MQLGFLRTRVARRILLLFVLSALLPATALSVVAYYRVRAELIQQSRDRMENVGKAAGMSVYERLMFLQTQLELYRYGEAITGDADHRMAGLEGVTLVSGGERQLLAGQPVEPVPLSARQQEHLRTGAAVVDVQNLAGSPAVLMAIPADPDGRGQIWGRVDSTFLWTSARGYAGFSSTAGFCVFAADGAPLRCNLEDLGPVRSALAEADRGRTAIRRLSFVDDDGKEYFAGAWQIFLDAAFAADPWMVVVAEQRDEVLTSLAAFRTPFLAVVIFGLSVVALLSNVQVRRTLAPLVQLKEATGRIARRDFDARVEVESDDEFEELGQSFNAMARNLGAQFGALETIGEIDRAILSELDRDAIVETVLNRVPGLFPQHRVAVILEDPEFPGTGRLYTENGVQGRDAVVPTAGLARATAGADYTELGADVPGPDTHPALRSLAEAGEDALLVPLRVRGEPAGYLVLVYAPSVEHTREDLDRLRQIGDQVSVALANARLIDDLESLTWGSLRALARAIDAKSPWTAGHSERVTARALEIGRSMGMDEEQLETLRRAGLLHDIGKIGIPGRILDKKDRLTPEEVSIMRSHTEVGARILEPVDALADVVPAALYHHEWYDGSGYPEGLAGEEIPFLARVLAVADVYDALTSNRPYRDGLAHEVALEWIARAAGTQFDPEIVEVFLQQSGEERVVFEEQSGPPAS